MSPMRFWTCSPSSFVLEWYMNIPTRKGSSGGNITLVRGGDNWCFLSSRSRGVAFLTSALHLLRWLCDHQRHHAWSWWDTEQACTSSPVTAQLITQLLLHLSFCFLLAYDYCPALISTSTITNIRLFSFGLLVTFMGVVNTEISKGFMKVPCSLS